MEPKNLVFIMSDEHNQRMMGVSGHPMVKTPVMDGIAARGVNFTNAYTNCPICVPARASFATGRYVHDIGNWDNASPYDGRVPAWGHRLIDQGHRVVSIGKLHYRREGDPSGFDETLIPLNVVDGVGDLIGLIRGEEMEERGAARRISEDIGPGESTYTAYDRNIAETARHWLQTEAPKYSDKPWVLFVSFVCPHFPLIAPQQFYDMYPEDEIPMPLLYDESERPQHPYFTAMRKAMAYDKYFDERKVRIATASYFGLCSFLDDNIGKVLGALDEYGLRDDTRVIYTSDHGESLGKRGFWGKSTMFDEAAAVPLMMEGAGVPEGRSVDTAVSLVDCFPTIIEGSGEARHPDDADLPGRSLFELADAHEPDRVVFSEYHAASSPTAMYMIRKGRWKYIHFAAYNEPYLFDMVNDRDERFNLADKPSSAPVIEELRGELEKICDPVTTDARARADQQAKIDQFGGIAKVRERGDFGYSPAPGQTPDFAR